MEKKATSKRYPPELKERAVRMVKDLRQQDPGDKAVISRVARQLGVGDESLRAWVKQSEIDAGARAGLSADEQSELKELRKEVKELRRSNDILQAEVEFFGAELDRRRTNSRLHRRPPRPYVRSVSMGGRADLRATRSRPPPPTTTPSPGRSRPGRSVTPSSPRC